MDFTVNSLMRNVVMFTFPIMLSVEGPLNFVKDCTAVLFISKLDDIETPKSLLKVTAILKFEALYRRLLPCDGPKEDKREDYSSLDDITKFSEKEKAYIDENPLDFQRMWDYPDAKSLMASMGAVAPEAAKVEGASNADPQTGNV